MLRSVDVKKRSIALEIMSREQFLLYYMYSKPNKINTIDLGRFVLFKLSFYNNIAFLANIANVRQNFQTKFTYTGAEEQFLLRGPK